MIGGVSSSYYRPTPVRREQTVADERQDERVRYAEVEAEAREKVAESEPLADVLEKRAKAAELAEQDRFQRQKEFAELPLENQKALQLYRQLENTGYNTPDAGELVGIDLIV